MQLATQDHRFVFQSGRYVQIEGDVGEGRLKAHTRGHVQVEDPFLKGLFHLRIGKSVVRDERCQQRVHAGERLRPGGFALERIEEIRRLAKGRAEVPGGRALHLTGSSAKTLAQ